MLLQIGNISAVDSVQRKLVIYETFPCPWPLSKYTPLRKECICDIIISCSTDIEDYLYGRKCSQYPSECIDSLIAKPLQDHVKMFGTKRYLICVDHMDECSAKKRAKWDIIGILHILIEKLPSKIYFLLSRNSKDRQPNGQKKKKTNNDLQNTKQKTKDRPTRTPLKTGGE
jgi:hypothetical protein